MNKTSTSGTHVISLADECVKIMTAVAEQRRSGAHKIPVIDTDAAVEELYDVYGLNPNFEVVADDGTKLRGYTRYQTEALLNVVGSVLPLVREVDAHDGCRDHYYYINEG